MAENGFKSKEISYKWPPPTSDNPRVACQVVDYRKYCRVYPNSFLSFTCICQLYYRPLLDQDAAKNLLSDPDKQAFFLMTNLRMVLVNFITGSSFDPSSVPDSLKQSFYFAVSDWDVVASCFCNGQASQCDANVSCRVVTY